MLRNKYPFIDFKNLIEQYYNHMTLTSLGFYCNTVCK